MRAVREGRRRGARACARGASASAASGAARRSSTRATRAIRCSSSKSGSVKIVLPSPEGEEGAIIATLTRGEFFGELALLDGAPHSATAVALEPTQTLVMRREPFERLIDEEPGAAEGAVRRPDRGAAPAHGPRRGAPLPRPSRAARVAPRAPGARAGAERRPADVVLDWPYTQSELASMIGGTRQTVNRLLADMVTRGPAAVREGHDRHPRPRAARPRRRAVSGRSTDPPRRGPPR